MVDFRKPLFSLGRCVATPAAIQAIEEAGVDFGDILDRHVNGDWGELDNRDIQANESAIRFGSRILSLYRLSTGMEIYVITDAVGEDGSREVTTIMLRKEY
jgi:hypothetical protein